MKKIVFVLTLFCFITVVNLVSYEFSFAQGAEISLSERKAQAAQFYSDGNFEQAFQLYSQLLREEPTDLNVNFEYARSAVMAGRGGHAAMAYERLLSQYPDEPILLQELAYALNMLQDEQRAAMELARNSESTPDENVALLQAWNQETVTSFVSGSVSGGVIYDSNVNSGPQSNDVTLGIWNLRLNDGKQIESFATYKGAQINYMHQLENSSPWWFVASGNVYARYNFTSKLKDLNLDSSEWAQASAGMRYATDKLLFEINLRAQLFDYAFEQNVIALGPEMNLIYSIHDNIHLISSANVDYRWYSSSNDYNGWYASVGQYARLFFGADRHYATIGARYINVGAEIARTSYQGFETSLEFSFFLPYDITFSPSIAYGGEYFNAPATALETEDRVDYRLRVGTNFGVPINDAWSVQAGYHYSKNFSNSALYDYDKHSVTAGVSWAF